MMGELVTGFKSTSFVEADFDMVPIGSIILWSGSIASIPAGWQLCDGTNGTPNLKQRFTIGAGEIYAVGERGGSFEHSHVFTGDGHTHGAGAALSIHGPGSEDAWDEGELSTNENAHGTTDETSTLPKFHALAYIQRLS